MSSGTNIPPTYPEAPVTSTLPISGRGLESELSQKRYLFLYMLIMGCLVVFKSLLLYQTICMIKSL